MSKYRAIIRRDSDNVDEEAIRLEFDETEMEKVLTSAEAILIHADDNASVFIVRVRKD